MADANRRYVNLHRVEYTLAAPSNVVELSKMIHWAWEDIRTMNPDRAKFDDALVVEADEEQIKIWFPYDPAATT